MAEMTTELRSIPGDKFVYTQDDYYSCLKTVDELPDPKTSPEKVIVITKPIGSYGAGMILVHNGDRDNPSWVPFTKPATGVSAVNSVRSQMVEEIDGDYRVMIRWRDPEDPKDSDGNILRAWDRTILVKKYGTPPTSIEDGTIVVTTTRDADQRNIYNTTSFIDYLPHSDELTESWIYKFFTVSQDGVITTSSACEFTPIVVKWEYMSNYIQAGWGPRLFGIGDVISIDSASDSLFKNMEFVVVGFDQYQSTNAAHRHSMTLMTHNFIGNGQVIPFDMPWGSYHITRDLVATGTKIYYTPNTVTLDGGVQETRFVAVMPPQGTLLYNFPEKYYDAVKDSRSTDGSNSWADSEIRRWLNWKESNLINTSILGSSNKKSPAQAFASSLGGKFMACVRDVGVYTRKVSGDDTALVKTIDKFFLPSADELADIRHAVPEATMLPYIREDPSRIVMGNTYWTRTPSDTDPTKVRYIGGTGNVNEVVNTNSNRVLMLCVLA